jgi:non-ribosomal peptide synthetase-like protein
VATDILAGLRASLYMPWWYRLMGSTVGKDCEIADFSEHYYFLELGEKCFLSDDVAVSDDDVRRGRIQLKGGRIGARVFLGNSARLGPGSVIPDGSLIGVKSRSPANEEMTADEIWFGSPGMRLPSRERVAPQQSWVVAPSRYRKMGRAVFEAFTCSFSYMLYIAAFTLVLDLVSPSLLTGHIGRFLALFVCASVAVSGALTLAFFGVKWILIGRFVPTVRPMWSWWALRAEAVAMLYWGLACPVLLEHLHGTPMLPRVMNLAGCKFGTGVFLDTTDFTEFDCIEVGDFVAINDLASLQTHLYEDRLMKIGRIQIEKGVTMEIDSTVLYDTHLGEFSQLAPLTVIMKGEEIPPHSQWIGMPAVQLRPQACVGATTNLNTFAVAS